MFCGKDLPLKCFSVERNLSWSERQKHSSGNLLMCAYDKETLNDINKLLNSALRDDELDKLYKEYRENETRET